LLSETEIQQIIPSPVRMRSGTGTFELRDSAAIVYQAGLENEAEYLAGILKAVTGSAFRITDKMPSTGGGIQLRTDKISVAGKHQEAYKLDISADGISITGSD